MLMMGAMGLFIVYNLILSLGIRVYGKPGYLLFSTPAKTWEIIVAKVLVNVVWIVSTVICCVISVMIMFVPLAGSDVLVLLVDTIGPFLQEEPGILWTMGAFGLISVLSQIGFFLFLFALLNLIYKGEKKVLVGIFLYIGLNTLISAVSNTFSGIDPESIMNIDSIADGLGFTWITMGMDAAIAGLMYFFAYRIMDRKMELQ